MLRCSRWDAEVIGLRMSQPSEIRIALKIFEKGEKMEQAYDIAEIFLPNLTHNPTVTGVNAQLRRPSKRP
jgi:hypothetical protein